MCNVSSSLAFSRSIAASTRCFFFSPARDAFSFLVSTHYRFSSPVIHMLELGLDLISTCIFPLALPVPYGLHCSTTAALAFRGKKALYERARPANECNFTIFDFTFNFFLCCVFFFISPCMLLETVCAVLMHICTHKEMSLFFLFSWEMRRHIKKCAQLAFFRCFDVRWHCSKVFYMFSVLADRHNNASAMAMASKNSRKSSSLPTHIGLTYRKNI